MLFIIKLLIILSPLYGLSQNRIVLSPISFAHIRDSSEKTIKITHGKVIKVKVQNSFISIIGKKEGTSELYIGHKKWNIHVLKHQNYLAWKELSQLFKKIKGLKLKVKGKKIIICGELLRPSDWIEISKIIQKHKASFSFEAKASSFLKQIFKNYFNQLASLKRFSKPELIWKYSFPYILLSATENKNKKIWNNWFKNYGLNVVFSNQEISQKKMIKVKMHFLEIHKSLKDKRGTDWILKVKQSLLPLPINSSEIDFVFEAIKKTGTGRILAEPYLIFENNSKAQFFAGGEIPIQVIKKRGPEIIWKKHGIDIEIKGKYNFQNTIRLEIKTQVSELDFSSTIHGAPSIRSKKFSSTTYMKPHQSLVLYSFHHNNSGVNQSLLPLLYKIPILGEFFKGTQFQKETTKMLIILTPQITG